MTYDRDSVINLIPDHRITHGLFDNNNPNSDPHTLIFIGWAIVVTGGTTESPSPFMATEIAPAFVDPDIGKGEPMVWVLSDTDDRKSLASLHGPDGFRIDFNRSTPNYVLTDAVGTRPVS